MIRTVWASLVLALSAVGLAACSGESELSDGGDLVTLYGAIETVDRGAVDPIIEPLFEAYGISFDSASGLTFANLDDLNQRTVRVDYPDGGEMRAFSGPLLREVLAIANPSGTTLTVTALDGYQRDIDLSRIAEHDVILAIRMDGEALNLGGFGPAMIVWPRNDDADLADMDDSDWVWGVFAIEIR